MNLFCCQEMAEMSIGDLSSSLQLLPQGKLFKDTTLLQVSQEKITRGMESRLRQEAIYINLREKAEVSVLTRLS